MYNFSMLLGSVIDVSDAFGVRRRSSPDTPELGLVGSSQVSRNAFDMTLLSDIPSLDVAR
jgi:hypothetical protein